jgi:hypothetical protein
VRELRSAPQLNSVCPQGLENTFVEENIFERESWERRPRSQDIARSLRPRRWRLVRMCFRQVSWRSRCSPRYLTSGFTGIGVVCRNTGGQVTCRVVKVTCADFAALTRIFHISNQSWRRVNWLWRRWESTVGSRCTARSPV